FGEEMLPTIKALSDEYGYPLNVWPISPPPGLEHVKPNPSAPHKLLELRLTLEDGCAKLNYEELGSANGLAPVCNPGSEGHPEMCNRPCVYLVRGGGCQLGVTFRTRRPPSLTRSSGRSCSK
ncbi:unnamed protein product, partial [Symbiodinium sp. KB8]